MWNGADMGAEGIYTTLEPKASRQIVKLFRSECGSDGLPWFGAMNPAGRCDGVPLEIGRAGVRPASWTKKVEIKSLTRPSACSMFLSVS